MTYWALGCVQKCEMWAWRRNEKKDRNFNASNWLFDRPPTSTWAPEILHSGSCPGSSYIFQVSWKSVQGSRSCGGSQIALSHWQGPWLIQQLVLPYKSWWTTSARSTRLPASKRSLWQCTQILNTICTNCCHRLLMHRKTIICETVKQKLFPPRPVS